MHIDNLPNFLIALSGALFLSAAGLFLQQKYAEWLEVNDVKSGPVRPWIDSF